MKKVLFIAATATLFAFSCQKEMESVQTTSSDGFSFRANAPALNNPGTKASINDSHGLVWAAGDKIGVYVNGWSTNSNQSFTLIGEGGTTSGSFRRTSEDWFNTDQAQIAFFPWTSDNATTVNTETDNNVSGSSVYFKLPGSYSAYSSSKMLTPLVAPVVYSGTEWVYEPIEFKHAGGAVKVKVSDLPAGAHSIGMTTASQQIHGNYHISVDDAGNSNMALDGDADASKKAIWLNFEPTTSSRPFTFLFPVPALNENEKLSFQIYDKNDVLVWSRSVSTHPAINHGDVLLLGNDDAISIEPYRQLKEVSSEWGVCGSYNDWASDTKMMTDGTSCIATGLTLSKDATFKIRKDGAWTVQYGAYQLQNKGTYADDAYDDNKIKILADGTYDIVFQTGSTKVFVVPTGDCPYPSKAHHYTSIKNATELGTTETANCYVITEAGSYKIPVVKGNDKSQSAGTVGGVELLWETYNNGTSVTKNSVIEAVDWDERTTDYIYFKTPDTLVPGNALIAAKDANGDIIWSWHIWIPATAYTTSSHGKIYNHELMDRNLGALVAATTSSVPVESYGLIYEWGRKDPFVGAKRVDSSSNALVSGTEYSVSAGQLTIAQSIAQPTVYANGGWGPWVTPDNNTLWQNSVKTIYDPCPAGYRVPARDSSQPMHSSDLSKVTGWSENNTLHYFTIGDPVAVFPFAGYRETTTGIDYAGTRALIWAAQKSTEGTDAKHMNVRYNGAHALNGTAPARGGSVRCVKIEEIVPTPATGISLDGSFSDWSDGEAIDGDGTRILEWKYAQDASNLYFYFKIPISKIVASDDGTYKWKRYLHIGFDTDNNASNGSNPGYTDENGWHSYGGIDIPCEAVAVVYPFRGNTTDGLSFINGIEEESWTRTPAAEGNKTGKKITAWGTISGENALLEIGVPRNSIGSPTSKRIKVQFRYSWDLGATQVIEIN